ncbi:phosphoribosyl-ATP diphosphatase, partial [Salmonella enterica subsp. enterica serovar Montevideo]|nr:phosphoribosyl-ATP diphosphatase [Salmonella enterica subsp. enterica serovar Montevideo]
SGTKRIAQKVGEEGVETALAATVNDRFELTNEASDLMYHLLVSGRKSRKSENSCDSRQSRFEHEISLKRAEIKQVE